MILIVKAGTDLNAAGEIDMFIAETVDAALEQWQECFNHNGQIEDLCSPVPKYVDVYALIPKIDDMKVEQ